MKRIRYRIIEDDRPHLLPGFMRDMTPKQKEQGQLPPGWTVLLAITTFDELEIFQEAVPILKKAYSNVQWAIYTTWCVPAGSGTCSLGKCLCYKYEGESMEARGHGEKFWHMMLGYVHGVLHTLSPAKAAKV